MNQEIKSEKMPAIWEIILDQVGHMKINGVPLLRYLGGKSFVGSGDDREGELILRFAKNWTVFIYYDSGMDAYDVRIHKGKFPKDVPVFCVRGIYVDQLAEVIHRGMGSP